jgi:hypothetical protein
MGNNISMIAEKKFILQEEYVELSLEQLAKLDRRIEAYHVNLDDIKADYWNVKPKNSIYDLL